jgi:lysophosphatidylcholine acyltransferase/lyso-PAF acetyltransferase
MPGAAVQPVTIRYPHKHADPAFVGAINIGDQIMSLMCQWINHIEFDFLPVYRPSQREKEDANLFASNVRTLLATSLNVPMSDHGVDDTILLLDARARHINAKGLGFGFAALKKVVDVNVEGVKALMTRFHAIDKGNKGYLTRSEFVKFAQTSSEEGSDAEEGSSSSAPGSSAEFSLEIGRLFDMLDEDDSGTLDFREFTLGLALINSDTEASRESALQLLFNMLDSTGRGCLHERQLYKVVHRVWPHIGRHELHEMFVEADKDHDGLMTCAEFVELAKKRDGVLPVLRKIFV